MDLSTLFRTIKQYYSFQSRHYVPSNGGYYVHTDLGPKWVTTEEDQMLLHWSFLWREELAKKQFRLIDRFIRTRDNAPFCSFLTKYIVIRDHIEGHPFNFTATAGDEKLFQPLGYTIGLMYRTAKDLDEKYKEHKEFNLWKQQRKEESTRFSEEKIGAIKKYLVTEKENMFLHLVKANWKQLEQRWKHARFLLHRAHPAFVVVPFEPNLDFFYLYQKKWLGYYSKTIQTSLGLQGVAQLVRDIYGHAQDDRLFQQFLNGLEESYTPSIEEHYEILAWIVYPDEFLQVIEHYMDQKKDEEESAQAWVELCEKQNALDVLQQSYAEKIDRLRKDAVSL